MDVLFILYLITVFLSIPPIIELTLQDALNGHPVTIGVVLICTLIGLCPIINLLPIYLARKRRLDGKWY